MSNELVSIVNQLQDVFSSGVCSEIDLPQIVVLGSQSAGKSSVLEHIVGKSFLPRGTGIVTRCPLVLQLVHAPNKTEEYAVFQHKPDEVFTNYDLIGREIEEQTIKLAGKNNSISRTPINLKIYSPSLLNLTLVDLPELQTDPVGDQQLDIEKQKIDLILDYIENPNSIILVVVPANVNNISAAAAYDIPLVVARKVDRKCKRTLAVVTKLDLIGEGTDSRSWNSALNSQINPFQLGTIGVAHSLQRNSFDDETFVKDSLRAEAEFFRENFNGVAAKHGVPYLKRTLQALFVNQIKKCMPTLKESICKTLVTKKTELCEYVKYETDDPNLLLLDLITKFTNHYISSVKGRSINIQNNVDCGLGKINNIFQEVFANDIWSDVNSFSKTNLVPTMCKAMRMHRSISASEAAFEHLAKTKIEEFRNPSLTCVQLVHMELINIAHSSLEDKSLQMHHYPKLKSVLGAEVAKLIHNCLPITNEYVKNFIDIQVGHINTSHPDFRPNQSEPPVEVEEVDNNGTRKSVNDLVRNSVECYLSIVCKIVQDTVQKTIMHFMVNSVLDQLLVELVRQVHRTGDVEGLLVESPNIVRKREALTAEIAELEKTIEIINTLKNIDPKIQKSQ